MPSALKNVQKNMPINLSNTALVTKTTRWNFSAVNLVKAVYMAVLVADGVKVSAPARPKRFPAKASLPVPSQTRFLVPPVPLGMRMALSQRRASNLPRISLPNAHFGHKNRLSAVFMFVMRKTAAFFVSLNAIFLPIGTA